MGKSCFFEFFVQVLTIPIPPKERMRGVAGDGLGGAEHKKSSQRNESHWLDLSHYSNDTMRGLLETGTKKSFLSELDKSTVL